MIDTEMTARLERIEMMLAALMERQAVKEWYTTEEFAAMSANPILRSANGAASAAFAPRSSEADAEHSRHG